MKSFIFITKEGYTYQPDSEAVEPDIENCQVIGFSNGAIPQEAFLSLFQENAYLKETTFNEVFSIETKNEERSYFLLNE